MTSILAGLFGSSSAPASSNPVVSALLSTVQPYVESLFTETTAALQAKIVGNVPPTAANHYGVVFSGLTTAQVQALWEASILIAADVATGTK